MSYAVSVSLEAEEDLRGIYSYITLTLLSPKNARGQISRLEEMIRSLDEFPMRHRLVTYEPWKSRGLHVVLCDNFLIFYFVQEEKHKVVVSRVIYGKRNIDEILVNS